ncbi:hypothetical protein [Vacuolonema iberomarrocanum]|uniref:hypothetical protein n=1 Tax=Vacuolonema iberomarrocanum TaxID=3454632 RepID=UPI0019EE2211|nr:hypothetical protein [filamentous cyanobacterium LEGE 07170]
MNPNRMTQVTFNLPGVGLWLTLFLCIWLLSTIGLGWLVKSVAILIAFLTLAPVIAFIGFRWWLRRNLVDSACPVCSSESVGLKGTEFRCASCGELLKVNQEEFVRVTPPGTIDVQAVEVNAKVIEDGD